ncbi:MAG: protein-export chaperone SecB [Betaproteobacteria bacterium RBG_16_58_11]|nr:MAG: protein-export chaperone SecB [Betaproteobacteria bacterium RBG_16_58_11]OFZ98422.1 MAG: protein-export chaperone SecB [Betaproteobacteria bacterium RBG_19FT_COMBO_58_11]
MSDQPQPQFGIEKLYVKDASLECPNSPEIFLEREAPQIEVKIFNEGKKVGEDLYEVTLTATVTAKIGERTAYLVEAAQAGIFRVANVPDETMELVMHITCPNMLFPYIREVISDMVGRAGFMPVYLAPVNFEMLYQQQRAQQAQAGEPAGEQVTAS